MRTAAIVMVAFMFLTTLSAALHGPLTCHRGRAMDVVMSVDQKQRVAQAMEIRPVEETSARSSGLALALARLGVDDELAHHVPWQG